MKRRTFLISTLLLLGGCASVPSAGSRERSGRFSLRAVTAKGTETASGRWKLSENAQTTELTLMTPLYGILARVTVSAKGATLERPGKDGQETVASAATAEELMQQHLGFGLPTEMLSSWLSGKPWKGAPANAGSSRFQQAGWEISVKRRNNDGSPALVSLIHSLRGITLTLTVE